MRLLFGLILGGLLGFGAALWFQGEPPFAGSPGGGSRDITITLSDAYLTRLAGPVIEARSNGLLSDVQVASAAGATAFVRGKARVAGIVIPAGVSLAVSAVNGSVQLDVRSAHVGPIPVPGVVVSPLLSAIKAKVSSLVTNSGLVITGAGTTDSGIEVFLKPG